MNGDGTDNAHRGSMIQYQYCMYSCYATMQFLVLSTCFIGLLELLAIVLAHSWFTAQIDALHLI